MITNTGDFPACMCVFFECVFIPALIGLSADIPKQFFLVITSLVVAAVAERENFCL